MAASPRRPGSPSSWALDPLASMEAPRRPGSPAMQNLVASLAYEGELKQIEVLRRTLTDMEAANARLQDANTELADSLQQLHEHAQCLEAQLAALKEESAVRVTQLEADAKAAEDSKQKFEAELIMLRLDNESQAGQMAQQKLDLEARAAEVAVLRKEVHVLQAQDPIRLTLTVSYEAELNEERAKSAAIEARVQARCNELLRQLGAYQRMERLQSACEVLGGRSSLRRVFQQWRVAAVERASMRQLSEVAAGAHRCQLLSRWLQRWRLAVQRSHMLAAREHTRQEALLQRAWAGWRQHCREMQLRNALEVAAQVHREKVVLRQIVGGWRAHAAAQQQVEWPDDHPVLVKAAEVRRRRLLASVFQAWQGWLLDYIKPKLAKLTLVRGHLFMGAQRRAWLAWREYLQHRRHRALLKEVADQQFLLKYIRAWQQAAVEEKTERTEALRGAISNQVLLLRRAWRAWGEFVRVQQADRAALAIAAQHRRQVVLRSAWLCWQEWVQLASDVKDRQRARALQATFATWRQAAKAAERRRAAVQFHWQRLQVQWRQAFWEWRELVDSKKRRLRRLAHAQVVLERWRLGRTLATWRQAVLVSKLQHSLVLVQQLQVAIEGVKRDLEQKAAEIESLESVKLTVETHAESLSLRVTSLDSELEAAERRAAGLQATLQQAQANSLAAGAARDEALAARDAAVLDSQRALSERDAAVSSKEQALSEAEHARSDRDAAQQSAEAAAAAREVAQQAQREAEQAAAAAAAERDRVSAQCAELRATLSALSAERDGLMKDLERALADLQRLADSQAELQLKHAALTQQHEGAVADKVVASAEKNAALKQAERLAAMCEDRERQCRQLQSTVEDLQAQVSTLRLMDEELHHLAARNEQLHAESVALQAKLAEAAVALEDRARLQASVEVLRAEEAKLLTALDTQQRQRRELAGLVESLQAAKSSVERQLQETQAAEEQLRSDKGALAQVVARLQGEQEGLVHTVDKLAGEKQAVEAQMGQLREKLQQTTAVLELCRETLAECISSKDKEEHVKLPLHELLGSIKALLHEKEAAITALAQENRDRAERVQAMQLQVDRLSRQVIAADARAAPSQLPGAAGLAIGGPASHPLSPFSSSATLQAGSRSGAEWSAASSHRGSPGSSASGASGGAAPTSPAGRRPSPAHAPDAADTQQFSFPAASPPPVLSAALGTGGSGQHASPSGMALRNSSPGGMALGGSLPGAGAASSSSTATPTSAQDPATPYIVPSVTSSAVPLGTTHTTRRFVGTAAGLSPLAASTAALTGMLRPSSAATAAVSAVSAAGGSPSPHSSSASHSAGTAVSREQPALGRPASPGAAGGWVLGRPGSPGAGWAGSLRGSPTPSTEQLRQMLLRPVGECSLPPDVSEQRLGFLLELVIRKHISTAEAQQVIKAAGEGDPRPLLCLLDSSKRELQGDAAARLPAAHPSTYSPGGAVQQQQQQQQEVCLRPGPALSPRSESELAAVRKQIQLLQSSIQPSLPD